MLISLYLAFSVFLSIFVPEILNSITSYIDSILHIDLNGHVYWVFGLIVLAIIENRE